jgi:DNA-binding SARP family transcriptional activator
MGRALLVHDADHHEPWPATRATRRRLLVDPYRERSYRAFMTLLAEQGRRAEALMLYQQLEELLHVQFGARPAPETSALASRFGVTTVERAAR